MNHKLFVLTFRPCSVTSLTPFTVEIVMPGCRPVFQPLTYCLSREVSARSLFAVHVWEDSIGKQETRFLIPLTPLSSPLPLHLLWQCISCCYTKATKLNCVAPLYPVVNEHDTNAQSHSCVSPITQTTAFLWTQNCLETRIFKKPNTNTLTNPNSSFFQKSAVLE